MSKEQLFEQASTKHLLVIGDLMLDEYVQGAVHRQSPEAPVDVLLTDSIYHKVGGAANVALNIQQLTCKTTLIGMVGNDEAGEVLRERLLGTGLFAHLIIDHTRPTTVKRRYLHGTKHLLRVDTEDPRLLDDEVAEQVLTHAQSAVLYGDVTGIVLSDYNKGLLSPLLIQELLSLARNNALAVYVDPKHDHFWLYKGVTIMKPNRKELLIALGITHRQLSKEDIFVARERLGAAMLICTRAADGIAGVDSSMFVEIQTEQIEVIDVSGAGDSVLAAMAVGHQCGLTLAGLLKVANAAGMHACLQSGVAVISLSELEKSVRSL